MYFYHGFDHVKKVALFILLLTQSMLVQAQAPEIAAEGSSSERQRTYYLTRWPEQRKVPVTKERVPPPPPGPYMSSALSGSSVNGFSFAPANKPAVKFASPGSPMGAFSPDTPWRSNSKLPSRWEPENGYSYVKPPVKKQSYPRLPYNMPPNYNYGYRAPVMNWPGTARPNTYARSRPVVNSSAMQFRQPANRAPYPATGKQ